MALRVAAFVLLLGGFGGLCFASWQLTRAAGYAAAAEELSRTFAGLSSLWNAINAVLGALVLVCKHLGTGFMVACGLALAMGYAICVGLGTVCVRMAWARR
jgi:hypothetical protein